MTRTALQRFLCRFRRDQRGVSAVEFAILAPVMVTLFFGMSVFCMGFMANKRMTHTNSAVADMVAQSATIASEDVDDILWVGRLLMQPFPDDKLGTLVTSVTRINGRDTVVWSRGRNYDSTLAPGDVYPDIPDDLIEDGEGLIVTETKYDYDSPVDMFLPEVTKFEAIHFVRPRLVETTTCADC